MADEGYDINIYIIFPLAKSLEALENIIKLFYRKIVQGLLYNISPCLASYLTHMTSDILTRLL